MKQLIVNADDFGRAPGVNRGILEAYEGGIVTSTTVMVTFPDAATGLDQALAAAPDLGIGLHLNLTAGKPALPVSQIPSLVDGDGQFFPIQTWAQHMSSFERDHIQAELSAQIERFISLAGRPPDHLDAHHHAVFFLPDALALVLDAAQRLNIPLREIGLDHPADDSPFPRSQLVPGLPDLLAGDLIERLKAILDRGPAAFCPARLETGFFDSRATLGDLLVILTNLPDDRPTELMCHPGYVNDVLGTSGYRHQREAEIGHLTHPATLECIRSEDIELLTFGNLARSAP